MADVVATAEAFASTDALREIWPLTTEVAVGTALVNGDRAGVAYTPSGGHQISKTVGGLTISGFSDAGVGLDELKVSVATDGSYEFAVTGATAATANGTKVYAVLTGVLVTGLTLTVGTNKLFGVINNPSDYDAPGAVSCVKIGV
jgi:hypothetical protein